MAGRQVWLGFWLGVAILAETKAMLCNDNTPVCVSYRGENLMFKNECDLQRAQQVNLIAGPVLEVSLSYCLPSCQFDCGPKYQPICGVSMETGERRTFRNRCEMARHTCRTKSDWLMHRRGICASVANEAPQHTVLVGKRKPPRPVPCTKIYRPVCAIYAGVKSTFSNECLVNAENIRTQRNWRIVAEGLCGEDSTKMKHNRKNKPKAKPKVNSERTKRSHKKLDQVEDFHISEDAVEIYAPSTFHTQFISNSGNMEKSYSLPARKPYVVGKARSSRINGNVKSCVFSNEPVCGSFNGQTRTFPNVCALMEYSQNVGNAWTILYEGSCRRCDKPCPSVYRPICANRNGINYTIVNQCYLERVRCKDPHSVWTITQKGECTNPSEEVSKILPTERSIKSTLIPRILYALKQSNSTTTRRTPTTSSKSRKQFKKPSSTTPMPKDLNNRKIRKIELDSFDSNGQATEFPFASNLWSSNDNWLVPQTLDNVKEVFNKKPATFKKAHKYLRIKSAETTPKTRQIKASTESPNTTTTATPLPTKINVGTTELTNLASDPVKYFMLDTKSTTALPPRTKQPLATSTTTQRSTTGTKTTRQFIPTSTVPSSPTGTTSKQLPTTTTTKELSTSTTSTPNIDYMADEPTQADSSAQTSIYGLDKNSLIMRLLRARSSRNLVL